MSAKTTAKKPKTKRPWRLTRRGFLIGAGVLGGLALGANAALTRGRQFVADAFNSGEGNFGGPPNTPSLWLEVSQDNRVILFVPKVEFGQGIHTALAQIAAEELQPDWKNFQVRVADTARGFGDSAMSTAGSTSVSASFKPLREAAANMRVMLEQEAARQLGVSAGDLRVAGGRISVAGQPDKSLTFGEVVAAKQGEWQLPTEVPRLKASRDWQYIGEAVPRIDFRAKLTGQAVYGYDARVEGMLYGAVARPPRYGATLKGVDNLEAVQAMPGVEKVVVDPTQNFAGVAARTRSQARRAAEALQVQWEGGITWSQEDLEARVQVPRSGRGGTVYMQNGDPLQGLRQGKRVEAEYRIPLAAHAHLEPQAALVDVKPDRVEAQVSTQVVQTTRDGIVKATGYAPEHVVIQPTYIGGAFGRKGGQDVAFEAAMLSKAAGKPVHLGWTRLEEMRYGYLRPPSHNLLRGAVDESGKITAIEHHIAGGDVFLGLGTFPEAVGSVFGFDPGALSGAVPLYEFENAKGLAWRVKLPVPTGWWRSLGTIPNTFALECFMDELAHAAGQDPVEFRLRHLGSDQRAQRAKAALQRAAELSGWGQTAEGTGKGVAIGKYGKTVVALVAEVSAENNLIKVERVTAVVDCGLVVNPNGAEAQAQGSIVMGVSSALKEKITLKDGMVEADNFGLYPLLTLSESPRIRVEFINSANLAEPYGMGEPVIGPVAPVVANAVFALTQKRLRELPLRLA
ncbi:MAG: molybdopterin cofactor-binding domain-containing protein [Meiothermus sp.]|nr:molybdopterin cofactor-binding domain-containing protein [Meiothermus sp.]